VLASGRRPRGLGPTDGTCRDLGPGTLLDKALAALGAADTKRAIRCIEQRAAAAVVIARP